MTPSTIVIVGRMNVGKSTLFNRIVGGHHALVSPIAGTTRDWQEAKTQWRDASLRIIDTGGVEQLPKRKERDEGMQAAVERATKKAIGKADVILFLVDGKEGLLPQDRALAKLILRKQKPIVLAVNKIDSPYHRGNAALFWKLGCGEPHPIAALTGAGVGDLLDVVVGVAQSVAPHVETRSRVGEDGRSRRGVPSDGLSGPRIPLRLRPGRSSIDASAIVSSGDAADRAGEEEAEGEEPESSNKTATNALRIAVIGKPNVGKSSLVNAILGEERVIVSPIAGTTREPIDTDFERDGKHYTLIDTAGIRRRAERTRTLEAVGVERTVQALRRSDVALLVVESNEPLASQDLRIARTLVNETVGVVIIANKWDLFHESRIKNQESREDVTKKYSEYIRRQMPHIAWAPILFVAAKTGHNVQKILAITEAAAAEREKIIPATTLTTWLKRLTYRPHKGGKKIRTPHIYGLKQTGVAPPTFELVTEFKIIPTKRGMQKETIRDSYVRFLENQLRATFGFNGTPIILKLRTIE